MSEGVKVKMSIPMFQEGEIIWSYGQEKDQ